MDDESIESWLAETLEDRRLSRPERQALREIAAGSKTAAELEVIRRLAFQVARGALANPADAPVVEWLEDVVKALKEDGGPTVRPSLASAYFSPGEDCRRAIIGLLAAARKAVDACVFTITDDRLADALIAAHRRGVAVRVLTDDAKAEDLGSDAARLEAAGIPLRVDRSPFHMHHKFAVFDGSKLLTGSYNWTRGAASDNEENLIVVDEPRLVGPFLATFERLWSRLA
jgi:mitochondrial cardiolipin hydrolase